MKLRLLNHGFGYGCAAAILFILAKVAKYGGSAASNEFPIYVLVILAGGLIGGLLWLLCRLVFCRDRDEKPGGHGDDDQDRAN